VLGYESLSWSRIKLYKWVLGLGVFSVPSESLIVYHVSEYDSLSILDTPSAFKEDVYLLIALVYYLR
jgi:hypothetical protein